MKVILFGSTGMVGQGVLRECLRDPEVSEVLAVVRSATGQRHAKLREIVHNDFTDFSALQLDGDASIETPGWLESTPSTSTGYTLYPPRTYISLLRPTSRRRPWSSTQPIPSATTSFAPWRRWIDMGASGSR